MNKRSRARAAMREPAAPAAKPLLPRRKLFLTLCIIFALWVGFLLALYFITIYPKTH